MLSVTKQVFTQAMREVAWRFAISLPVALVALVLAAMLLRVSVPAAAVVPSVKAIQVYTAPALRPAPKK